MNQGRREAGFTLMELMLVVLIIGILASVVYQKFTNQGTRARVHTTRMQIKIFESCIDTYELEVGVLPEKLADLLVDPGVPGWNGPYLKGESLPDDPWGSSYLYRKDGALGIGYELRSVGKDQVEGTEDDISVRG